jgi:hypothetical protein
MANKRLTGEPGARIKLGVVTRIGHGALRVAVALSLGSQSTNLTEPHGIHADGLNERLVLRATPRGKL